MSAHEYVKYIQYTLAASGKYSSAIDGVYGPKTSEAVRSFQVANNERYIDGKVDSETKWYLAKHWLNLKGSNAKLYEDYKAFAEPNIRKYIQKVEDMGLTSNLGSGRPYRKITFTGFAGPKLGEDILFFETPPALMTVDKITIIPDSDSKWRNYKAVSVGWSKVFITDIFKSDRSEPLDLSAKTSNIDIPMNGRSASDVKYIWVAIRGDVVSGLGYGEGFGISSIQLTGLSQGESTSETVTIDQPVDVTVTVNFTSSQQTISPAAPSSINLSRVRYAASMPSHYISRVSYSPDGRNTKTVNLTSSSGVDLNTTNYVIGDVTIPSFLEDISSNSISISDLSVSDVSSGGITASADAISIRKTSDNNIILETSSTFYGDAVQKTTSIDLSSNFRLKSKNGSLFPQGKNTINYGDGVVLFCDSSGKPIGIPKYADIVKAISNPATLLEEERDLAYGYFSVFNELPSEGLRYGFYDLNTNEFLGTTINYIDFYRRSAGSNFENIFIAICGLDADGLIGDNEFIGLNNSTTFLPTRIPLKYLVPVYSVRYNYGSSIRVNSISENLSKFDAWELPVSNGSFNKAILLKGDIQWTDWKSNYSGQELIAEYSTTRLPNVVWSKVYGYGYYDVNDETPIVVDSKTIKVRRTPILSWNYNTDYQFSVGGIIKQDVNIYTRANLNSVWQKVDPSAILSIDCQNGVVRFKKRVVPLSDNLIKVSYVTENKNSLVRHVAGTPVPLNPFLNASTVQFDKAMYIYITPRNIYKKNPVVPIPGTPTVYEKVQDYNYSEVLNFTYSPQIFDENSISYDPFALCIAIVYVTNNPDRSKPVIADLRLRGGGVKSDVENSDIIVDVPDILSYWDTYPSESESYMKGGYVIIRIPQEVKKNFTSSSEIYNIIRNNLTAGIVFDLQDMEGNSWS